MQQPRLVISRLRLQIGSRVMEEDGSLALESGKVYIVQGPSGVGKSSLARVLLGLGEVLSPGLQADGDVHLEDAQDPNARIPVLDEGRFNPRARDVMALLPQSNRLGFIDELGTAANVRFFSTLPAHQVKPEVEKLATRLRIWPLPHHPAVASGGERMRISAVRALLPRSEQCAHPALLVADEPTTGLDPAAARELSAALLEVARNEETIVVIITHDMGHFVKDEKKLHLEGSRNTIHVIECGFQDHELIPVREAGRFVTTGVVQPMTLTGRARQMLTGLVDILGAFVLAPIAMLLGVAGMRRRTAGTCAVDVTRAMFDVGTWVFVATAALMVAVTFSIFMFQYFPRRELVEPLLLEDILSGMGTVLVLMLMPLFAAMFTTAKIGAAQAARLSSAVRSGLLDTLALARITPETYALVPAVIGQVLALCVTTALACFLGLAAAGMVFVDSGSELSLDRAVAFMRTGVVRYDCWLGWLAARTVVSGAVAGVVAALFGLQSAQSERDVARAVHRTLLWSLIAVLAVQCAFIIAQFGK